jgi:DNA-binding MurR/RpiR family transcriptional regulator
MTNCRQFWTDTQVEAAKQRHVRISSVTNTRGRKVSDSSNTFLKVTNVIYTRTNIAYNALLRPVE